MCPLSAIRLIEVIGQALLILCSRKRSLLFALDSLLI